jgi:pilus assembly protein Flp/PilA
LTLPLAASTISLDKSISVAVTVRRRMAMMKFELINSPAKILSGFIRDESGQDLIEYALVAAIIALGATAAMTTLAGSITSAFTKIGTSLTNAV